ncbi:asparagine synthase C-terminal domain-containing protein [Brevundimonas sp.]|uniref:asparagine synthase C-terminal domain-containing protein n=1 Tax=Brevundimonas sp. TaxID=1871086 RepID=UPI002BE39836|nr:asparagine synthase C-terminal domain-containing protein [Brevundimonas sp.]HWQ85385.1 asparagine synthase C-terminal domain-containing protein [Brevundimonas sp.]
MGDYLIVVREADDPHADALSAELARLARSMGMVVSNLHRQAWLGVKGPQAPGTLAVGPWILVGDVFNRRRPVLPGGPDDPDDYERKLVARFWGRYVGVRFGAKSRLSSILRDPSGALECIAWSHQGLTFVGSDAPEWLVHKLRPPWRINVERLSQALLDPFMSSGPLLLDGPVAIDPGTVQPLPLDSPARSIWRPADIALRSLGRPPSLEDAAASVRSAIDEAVTGLAGVSTPVAAEVSGGLDSSLVASSLTHRSDVAVGLWLSAYGATPESDERSYVAALAEALAIVPTCVPHATGAMTEAWLERASQGLRPGVNALDRPHDMDWAARLRDAGVTALMTGKGGDSILLQRSTTDVFTDLWLARGWRALLARDVPRLAAENETSVWSMVGAARRHGRADNRLPVRDEGFLVSRHPPVSHPWLAGCQAFGPAKTLQIAGVLDSVSRHGPSMLTETVDVRHPMCAQPVIEACLAIPTPLLTHGGRDRGLARYAFRERLPTAILERRSKGDMTRIYARMILDNLAVLRPWLLDGRLAALGVLDRDAADRLLTRESLIWRGSYSTIIVAAAFEGWVRAWERRLPPPA